MVILYNSNTPPPLNRQYMSGRAIFNLLQRLAPPVPTAKQLHSTMVSRVSSLLISVIVFATFSTAQTATTALCNSVLLANDTPPCRFGCISLPTGELVGINCSPISTIDVGGNSCSKQLVCCRGKGIIQGGLLAIGCTPVTTF
ncbi:Hydrophobin [Pleurotus pulmonarius]